MLNPATSLPPGFRFHPTDEELILHYMRNRAAPAPCPDSIIAEVDIYKFDPWELPAKAMFGDREWYFFSPRDRKYPNGVRPNRAAASGYWKATGTDKPIHASAGREHIGVKKALVFYKGRPPKGLKTNWIMHEYRLAEARTSNSYKPIKLRESSMRLDDWVLCRIYKKNNHPLSTVIPPLLTEPEQDVQEEHTLQLPKSSSISEFLNDYSTLSQLFDKMPERPGPEDESFIGDPSARQPFIGSSSDGNDINYLLQQLSQAGSSALMAGNYLKRQRTVEEEPSKIWNDFRSFNGFADQLDSPQCSMMNQSLFNQQLLLNSHLRLQ